MNRPLRFLTLTLATITWLGTYAQGHTIYVAGHANPCTPAMAGSLVNITAHGITGISTTATTTMNENCYYYLQLLVPDTAGLVMVSGSCGNGIAAVDSAMYSLTPPFTTDVIIDLNCGSSPPACQACFNMVQTAPNTATFTSCSSGGVGPYTYLWDISGPGGGGVQGEEIVHVFPGTGQYAVCLNITDAEGCMASTCHQVYVDAEGNLSYDAPNDCQACFTISQTQGGGALIPWTVDLTSCSVGTGTLLVEWALPDGSLSNGTSYTFVANSPGLHIFCAYLSSSNGCSSTICDSVYFSADGWISTDPIMYDCLQIPNGPNVPGSPCTNPATGATGTWSANCECITNTTGCQAGFWVIQAYEGDSLNGVVTPIPYELWIWNLSSGNSPFQFLWNFGDGSTSTDPYPTHVYAQSGPYNLCLTLTDASGCTSTSCDSVSIDGNGLYDGMAPVEEAARNGFTIRVVSQLPTGIADQPVYTDTRLWPNPVNEVLNLRFNTTLRGNLPMSVVDVNGRVVLSANAMIADGTNQLEIATGSLPAGMYMLRMGSGQETMSFRFVKN